jgi:hypothetical protein
MIQHMATSLKRMGAKTAAPNAMLTKYIREKRNTRCHEPKHESDEVHFYANN